MSPRLFSLLLLMGIIGCQASPAPIVDSDQTSRKIADSSQTSRKIADNNPTSPENSEVVRRPLPIAAPLEKSPTPRPAESPADHLAEASRCIERDDLKSAGVELATYLDSKPDVMAVRVQYAEVLAGQNRHAEARNEFNRFLALAQEQKTEVSATMIHVYRRLMEVAEESRDEYGVHLNRGIGLFLLAQSRARVAASEQELPVEGLLCKAAAELTQAHDERPGEAQASWYLYQVWSRLGQRHAALAHLHQARDAAPFTYLSPAESRKLSMACLEMTSERSTH